MSSTSYADDPNAECTTQPDKFWLCAGDTAWDTGYLIPPAVLDLRECMVWEEKAKLLDETVEERDEFQQQRDQALQEALRLTELYDQALAYGDDRNATYERCAADLEDSYETWEVVLIGSGTGAGALVLGILIGAVAF